MSRKIWKCLSCPHTLDTSEWSYERMANDGNPGCTECDSDMELVPDPKEESKFFVSGVTVTIGGVNSLSSTWERELCQHCNKANRAAGCDCIKPDVDERLTYNGCLDGIESLILSCAAAGIDIESSAFKEAVDTAKNAADNNLIDY